MRILHVVPTYLPAVRYGGPIRSVHALAAAQTRQRAEVEVFTTNVDGPGRLDVPIGVPVELDGVRVTYFACGVPRRLYRSPELGRALESRVTGFDIVHLHSVFLWPTAAAGRAARRHEVPYVVSPRGMLVRDLIRRRSRLPKEAWLRFVERDNLEGAARIHFTSRLELDEALAFPYRWPPGEVVPNGVEPEPGANGDPAPAIRHLCEGAPFVLFLGRLSWKKGLDRLIPAMRALPGTTLVVAGPDDEGLEPALRSLALREGVVDHVRFIGPVHGADKIALLRAAALLAVPSYSENFGNVVLEALLEGCPVALTREVGAAPIVEAAGAGRVVPGDPPALGRALAELLADDSLRRTMGAAGREVTRRDFSWDAVAKRMDALYRAARAEPTASMPVHGSAVGASSETSVATSRSDLR